MKIREIKDKMANIAPDLIEEAANYKRKRVSGIRVIALAACLALLVTSIPLALIMSRKDEPSVVNDPGISQGQENKGENDKVTVPEDMLVIFCSSPSELKKQFAADSKVEIKNANERINFTAMKEVDAEKKDGTPYIRTITIDNITYNASYVYSKTVDSAEQLSDHYQKYVSYDRYQTPHYEEDRYGVPIFHFSQETGKLISFRKGSTFFAKGDLSESELRKIIVDEIYNLYGIQIEQNTDYIFESHYKDYQNDIRLYFMCFRRYINGYATDEDISFMIDTSGQIIGITQNLGLYDTVVESISETLLNKIQTKLYKALLSGYSVKGNSVIALDQYGKCWLKSTIVTDQGRYDDTIFVEIK